MPQGARVVQIGEVAQAAEQFQFLSDFAQQEKIHIRIAEIPFWSLKDFKTLEKLRNSKKLKVWLEIAFKRQIFFKKC